MIANGLPSAARHSTVWLVELNGPNQTWAANSLAAAARLRPTETVSRKSSSAISTTRPALVGQGAWCCRRVRWACRSCGNPWGRWRYSCCRLFGRLPVKSGRPRLITAPRRPIRMPHASKRCVSSQPYRQGNLGGSDVCNLGKVQTSGAKHLTRARNRPRRAASRSLSPSPVCQLLNRHACYPSE
jgi:hypothetical protein